MISRVRSIRTKTEKRLEKKYPKTVFVVVTLRLMFELVRYYADVVGDAQLVWQMRNNDQLRAPFLAMVFFIGLQLCLGSAGLVAYMRYEHKASIPVLLAVSVFSPPLVLALDTLMLMYRPTERFLPGKLVIFMVQYEAVRKLTEVIFESLPQSLIQQSLLTFACDGKACNLGAEDQYFLFFKVTPLENVYYNLALSLLSLLYEGMYKTYVNKKAMGLTYKGYFKHLMTMGAGLPLSAIKNNKVVDLDYSLRDLTGAEVHELATVLKANKSLKTFKLNWRNMREEHKLSVSGVKTPRDRS